MSERGKSEISPQKRSLKLSPYIGDWTTYKPQRTLVKRIKLGLYGFDRLSERELNQAHILHYNFAAKLCKSLRAKLKLGPELYAVEAHQNSYSNFLKASISPIFQGKITSTNNNDEIFVSLDLSIADSLINSALGSQDISKLGRGLNETEELILDTIISENFEGYFEIFKDALQNPKFNKVGSPNLSQDFSINPQSTFVYFTMEISLNGNLGKITFGYNGTFLKNLLKTINQNKKHPSLPLNKMPPAIFSSVELPVSASIGKSYLTMPEIQNLEIGDVISFEQNIDSAIEIALFDGRVILGQIGKKDNKIVVRVVSLEKEKTVKVPPPAHEPPEEAKEPGTLLPEEDLKEEAEFQDDGLASKKEPENFSDIDFESEDTLGTDELGNELENNSEEEILEETNSDQEDEISEDETLEDENFDENDLNLDLDLDLEDKDKGG